MERRASGISEDDAQRRDALLLKVLRMPPRPRPKRERGKDNPANEVVESKLKSGGVKPS